MTNWFSEASLYSMLPLSMGGVAVGGLIAAMEAGRRRNLQRLLSTSNDAESLRQEIARIEQELETRRAQLAQLDEREIEAKQRIAQANRLESQIAELEAQRDQLKGVEEQTRALKAEAEDARTAREIARSQLAEIEVKRDQLVASTASLDAQLVQLESDVERADREAEAARDKLEAARNDLTEAIAQRQAVNEHLADAESRRAVAESMLKAAEQRLAVCERREEELSGLEDAVLEAREELAKVSVETDRLRDAAIAAEERAAKLTSRSEAIAEQIEQLRLERAQLTGQPEATSAEEEQTLILTRFGDIWNKVLDRHNTLPSASEADKLAEVRTYLRDHGLIFPDRVVYAFHTSLKVSSEATLLILAGISGTGKSLLPQRYAEGMGFNFQLVPVQPRWDGPQDLLGFYNFLQEKYVGTELIRALAQMHLFPEEWSLPDESKHVSLKDQMLLVLLDEMNLARIEYYFSDLLVKLETRRTINPAIRESRLKASLELSGGPGCSPLHVFPGSNCLFVGTMNEDESTQSVSDKVVDRANVMRFAKPAKLQGTTKSSSPSPPASRLSRETWNSWQKDAKLSSSEEEKINSAIDELNEALEGVERPFGHRVKKAIVQYVSMYPRHSAKSVDHALADQIEMRILPKLRGIELGGEADDCLQRIEDLTEDLDQDLAEAIRSARSRSPTRFHWLGISRDSGAI